MEKSSHTEDRTASLTAERRLWNAYPATPAQQSLPFPASNDNRPRERRSQADIVLGLLREARAKDAALPLPMLLQAGIAQHGARVLELRRRGFEIKNHMQRAGGTIKSDYTLVYDPEAGR